MRRCDWLVSRRSTRRPGWSGGGEVRKRPEALRHGAVLVDVLEVADDERAAAPAGPAALAERDDALARERPQVLLGAQDGAPERMVAERGLVDDLLGHHRGLVLVALDLLDDHAALAVELARVDLGPAHEVGEEVDRLYRRLGAHRDVEGDEVVARVRVQDAAHALG